MKKQKKLQIMFLSTLIDDYNVGQDQGKLNDLMEKTWMSNDTFRRDDEVVAVLSGDKYTLYEGAWEDNGELFNQLDTDDVIDVDSIDEYIHNNQLTVHRDFTSGTLERINENV